MYMEWLQAERVRNLSNIQIHPAPGINVFTGKNASGKTAVLEAVFLLSQAKSFRTPRIQEVITHGAEDLAVSARLRHEADGEIRTRIHKAHGNVRIMRNDERVKTLSDQARQVPIILITQDTQRLVTEGPRLRRHWLDWAMFHVEPDYLGLWKRYMRALRHRNMLLKNKERNLKSFEGWEIEMAETGEYLTERRHRFLEDIERITSAEGEQPYLRQVSIRLAPGWPAEKRFLDCLVENRTREMERGTTHYGIHQADVLLTEEERRIAASFSRGQIKLYAAHLVLSQAKETERRTGVKSIIIMDDFKAELDNTGSKYILSWLLDNAFQAFISTTVLEETEDLRGNGREFHVEQGKIN